MRNSEELGCCLTFFILCFVLLRKDRRSYMNHLGLYSSYNSCTGVSLSSHRLSSLKAVVRNEFLTTANSHRLHSLLLLLWTKWFFRPACIKILGGAYFFELHIFLFLSTTYLEILSRGNGNKFMCASYGLEIEWGATGELYFSFFKITCLKFLFCKIIGSYLFTKSGEERQSRKLFLLYKNAQRLARGHGIL